MSLSEYELSFIDQCSLMIEMYLLIDNELICVYVFELFWFQL